MMADYLSHYDACRVELDSVIQVALDMDSEDILIALDLDATETEVSYPANLDHMKKVKAKHSENNFRTALEVASKMSKGVILYVTWGKLFNTEKEVKKRWINVFLNSDKRALTDIQSVVKGPLVGDMVNR